jgi:uncharacterized membrane protein YhdT
MVNSYHISGKKNDLNTFSIDFLMGGGSAAVSKTFFWPISVMKIRWIHELSSMDNKLGHNVKPYRVIIDFTTDFFKKDGIRAFFRGNKANIIQIFPYHATNFSLKDTDGITGLYRGFIISCVVVAIYRGLYFGLFDSLKPMLPTSRQDSLTANFLLGWCVTAGAAVTAYPVDIVRRRIMKSSN